MNNKESISEKMAIDEMVSSDASAGYSEAVAAKVPVTYLDGNEIVQVSGETRVVIKRLEDIEYNHYPKTYKVEELCQSV